MLDMVEGRRRRSKPSLCWNDGVKAQNKLSLPELQEVVQNKDVCRNPIMKVSRILPRLDGTG